MTAITVSNTDWSIVDDVRDALAAASIAGSPVFASVTVAAGEDGFKDNRLHSSPAVVVRYAGTREYACPEDVRGACVLMEIVIAASIDEPGQDESARLAEILRLKNAAINAVEAEPPAAACNWGSAGAWQDRIRWHQPRIDTSAGQPWTICRMNLEIGYVVPSGTGH